MQFAAGYTIFLTDKLHDCRTFYERLGFQTVFAATWFVFLTFGESGISIAFMAPDHPSSPPDPKPYVGDGAFLTLQVVDAAAAHDEIVSAGFTLAYPLTSERWGQRRFALIDPAGVWVDIVEQTEPAPGFWDPYLVNGE